jgi:hypothetical protein
MLRTSVCPVCALHAPKTHTHQVKTAHTTCVPMRPAAMRQRLYVDRLRASMAASSSSSALAAAAMLRELRRLPGGA